MEKRGKKLGVEECVFDELTEGYLFSGGHGVVSFGWF